MSLMCMRIALWATIRRSLVCFHPPLKINNSSFDCGVVSQANRLHLPTDDKLACRIWWPPCGGEERNDDCVSIECSVLWSKPIDHNVNIHAIDRYEGSVSVILVDSEEALKECPVAETLLDLIFDLDILFEIDALLVVLTSLLLTVLTVFPLAVIFTLWCSSTSSSTLLWPICTLRELIVSRDEFFPSFVAFPLFLSNIKAFFLERHILLFVGSWIGVLLVPVLLPWRVRSHFVALLVIFFQIRIFVVPDFGLLLEDYKLRALEEF